MRSLIVAAGLGFAAPGLAADVVVSVTSHNGPLQSAGAEAIVWHALHLEHGLEAVVVPGNLPAPQVAARMREEGVSTWLDVEVHWVRKMVDVGEGLVAIPPSPDVYVTERVLGQRGFLEEGRWRSVGAPSVYRVPDGASAEVLTLPDVSLQEATRVALRSLTVPAWGGSSSRIHIPVLVTADEDYRRWYGGRWRAEATARVRSANPILAQAGIALDVVGFEDWEAPPSADLSVLLHDLASRPSASPSGLRVAFTQRRSSVGALDQAEDVGRAYTPGRDVVVVDQAQAPGHDAAWDVAEEGVVVAHEVLHALGAPHAEAAGSVMSAQKSSLAWRLDERTIRLAHAAAEARHVHWDKAVALLALSSAAETWLAGNPRSQLAFVVDNLGEPPRPGALDPERTSALANAALAHAYLRLADADDDDAERHRSYALAHVAAAMAMAPGLSDDLAPLLEAQRKNVLVASEAVVDADAVTAPEASPTGR